ncbi:MULTISPECIES: DUF2007 domain-containing protein [unclassified Arenibacter]|uniref:DUF2007 domain-containing protein n=1 Tax=unclassified Arenibacter TaxID=2615047 RepID=UPI000E343744|nr:MULTISPECIES: DUF2007 domain-containing protein [unclassified Arenibacter]MCM4162425.1 hypothetical protein [Arenibacter sp. A80]RFT58018.1 DUF2007 domain-containing protein [Arenibacter sp. P308M17]
MNPEFYTLAAFEFVADVQILKGRLEADGIPVFLRDEHILNSDPLISNAIGGVKLQVYYFDRERATEIYNEIRTYAMDDQGNLRTCPNCKSKRMEIYYNRKGVFYKLFPFFEKRKYKCLNCEFITEPS